VLALVSGAAALVYETIWMRWFRLAFGSTSHAVSATLSAYFIGLAIGAALFGRLSGRTARPLRLYGRLELGAGAAALFVPLALQVYDRIYPSLYGALSGAPLSFLAVKVGMALAAMLPCAILLGGSLPPLTAACLGHRGDLGREGARLYWANLSGGVLGAVAGGIALPELLGVPGTYTAAIAGSAVAGGCALWLDHRSAWQSAASPAPASETRAPALSSALGVAVVSGFGLLAFEVLLIHTLGRFFVHTAYSFGLVLAVVLSCLAAGAAAVSWASERLPVASVLCGALLLEALLLWSFPWAVLELRDRIEPTASPLAWGALAAGAVGAPSLLVAALIFPLTFRLASAGPVGPRVGGLLAANTLGGIAGSLAASFVLLEALGLWGSFGVLGLAYAASAPWLAGAARSRTAWALAAAVLAVGFAATPLSPWRLPSQTLAGGERLVASTEGADGLVSVVERNGERYVAIDEHYQFGGTSESALYQRMGRLPLLLHPDPKRVLVIGSATGGLAASAVELPVAEIVLVEIIRGLHDLAATWFADHNLRVHSDPRTRLVTEDGRNYLRAARERYDVIVEDLYVPHHPTAAAMYTEEHYRDAAAHLSERGVFCQWLPLYQLSQSQLAIIVATFTEVFPQASLWTPSFRPLPILGLVGTAGAPPSVEQLAQRGREIAALGVRDPWLTDSTGLWSFHLGAGSALDRLLGAATPHRDAHPSFEFVSARATMHVQMYFASVGWPRLVAQLLDGSSETGIFREAPRDPARGGEALAAANRHAAYGRVTEAQQWLERASRLIPASLLAARDDSISAVWPADIR
jgi:spermidine synthase